MVICYTYRPNTASTVDIDVCSTTLHDIMDITDAEHKNYLDSIFTRGVVPMITKLTKVTMSSASLIDHIYTNNLEYIYSCTSGIVITDLADHFGIFH